MTQKKPWALLAAHGVTRKKYSLNRWAYRSPRNRSKNKIFALVACSLSFLWFDSLNLFSFNLILLTLSRKKVWHKFFLDKLLDRV
jgi:hypothetical protein